MTELIKDMDRGAQFSECRTYRYVLWRTWDNNEGRVMFIGLNPSTADETEDDATIRRCMRFARNWDYGGIYMVNLFAFRATDPKEMKAATDPVGERNDVLLADYGFASDLIICAWGTHGGFQDRDIKVYDLLSYDLELKCLGLTKEGFVRHPLYLKADTKPLIYEGRSQ